MIVVAIIGIVAAAALPSWRAYQQNQQLRAGARMAANVLTFGRTQAIATSRNHIVLFGIGPMTDLCGNPLQDALGNPVPFVVIDDGPPGAGDCCITNAGEVVETLDPRTPNVSWGATFATAPAPLDSGLAAGWKIFGSSFRTPAGVMARGVLFRPDGVPVSYTAACNLGATGSGGGALYVTNGERDYGIVLTPIGGVHVERWENSSAAWSS